MEKQTKVYAGLSIMIVKDGKLLMGKRMSEHGPGTWCFPGGHIEPGETWEECAIREVSEECGLKITNIRFETATNDIFESGKHYITIHMIADYVSGEPEIREPDNMIDWQWVTWEQLPQPLFLSDQRLLDQGYHPFQ